MAVKKAGQYLSSLTDENKNENNKNENKFY